MTGVRLTRRLLLALFAAILAVTVVESLVRVAELRNALLDDTREDYVQFARSFRSVLTDAWNERGEAEVRRLVERADETTGTHFRISIVSDALSDGREHVSVEEGQMVVVEPLGIDDAPGMAIRIEQPLDTLDAIVARTAQISVLHAGTVLLASGLLMSWLGWLFVGRPVQRLIETTRRIARGERVEKPDVQQDDELGELANELTTMAEKLDEARVEMAKESTAKVQALEQLRHADRLRSVGQLASGLAHELGTPLNVVSGRARLIETAEGVSEELQSDARVIRDETAKMTGLVKQLLGFARRKVPQREEADVAGAAARVTQMLGPLAAKRGVSILLAAPGGPCVMRGDPLLIEQAITNVAVNGIQAMGEGGTLSISVAQRLLARPGSGERVPSAIVSVVDDGPGITDEVRASIFDPFFTTKDVGEGTGLGLSVVYGIALDHGGFVQVENEPGRGARFDLVFPLEGKYASIAPSSGGALGGSRSPRATTNKEATP